MTDKVLQKHSTWLASLNNYTQTKAKGIKARNFFFPLASECDKEESWSQKNYNSNNNNNNNNNNDNNDNSKDNKNNNNNNNNNNKKKKKKKNK